MRGRTIILVSHHVQLCVPGASYVVALDNGRLQFQGTRADFEASGVLQSLSQTGATDPADNKEETAVPDVEEIADAETEQEKEGEKERSAESSETASTAAPTAVEGESKPEVRKAPRKLVEEEKRAVGRISKDIWTTYLKACGGALYWTTFAVALALAAASPVLENGWLKCVRFALRFQLFPDRGL